MGIHRRRSGGPPTARHSAEPAAIAVKKCSSVGPATSYRRPSSRDICLQVRSAALPKILNFASGENRSVQNYVVIIHKDGEGGFWGEVPALPGCYSQAETIDELKQNI